MVRLIQQLKSLTAQGATRLGRQLDARARWDGQATWYRLRYDDAEQTRSALDLLSRCSGGRHSGRVGLRWRTESGVSRLYVGLFSVELNRLAGEMARDLGFTLTAAPQLAAAEDDYLHDGVDALPSPLSGAFCYAPASGETAGQGETGNIAGAGDGYIINGHLFALQRGRANGAALTAGYAFPTTAAVNGHTPGLWRLPPPVLGLALRPQWRPPLSLDLPAAAAEQVGGEAWLLGRNVNRQPVYGQRVSVLGELDAIQQWLAQLVVAQAVCNPVGVVVIDGEGDLVPRLLTEPVIARLLQTKRATSVAAAALRAVLDRLLADGTTARWLCQQPVDLGALLPRGMLLVSCPYQRKRSRAQALRALPPILTFHGAAVILRLGARAAIPLSREEMNSSPFIRIVTDSADLAETVIVTRSEGHRLASLTNHLLPQLCPDGIAPQMFQEYVGQLGAGEALALRRGRVSWVGWR
jgi:hypothetical protein